MAREALIGSTSIPRQLSLTVPAPTPPGRRPLSNLHFTGAMRPQTLIDMAREKGTRLPPHLLDLDPLTVPADARGWFRFQRSYDAARHLARSEAAWPTRRASSLT